MADIYLFKYNNLKERKNINKSVLWKVTKIDRINMSIKMNNEKSYFNNTSSTFTDRPFAATNIQK